MMKKIHSIKDNSLLVLVVQSVDWKKGLQFFSDDDDFIQVGTWWYDAGKTLDRHYHNVHERVANITQECVIVLNGQMRVCVYDTDQSELENFVITTGEFAIFFGGGHAYEILQDDTKILETKNGPFLGLELDKTRF